MGKMHRRTKAHGSISIHCIDEKEVKELKRLLSTIDVHSTMYKSSPHREGYFVSVAKMRDVIFTCISIFQYLKNQEKREKMANNWRELGWCICDHV
jgi:hypothetical protein